MAKLPRYQQQLTTRVATPGAAPVAQTGQGLQALSAGMADFAKAQQVLQDKEARTYTLQAKNDVAVGLEAEKQNLTNTAKTGQEYLEGVTKYLESQKDMAVNNAPNQQARNLVVEYYDSLQASTLIDSGKVAAQINANNEALATEQALQINFNLAYQNPDQANQLAEEVAVIIGTSNIPASQKEAVIKREVDKLYFNQARGLLDKSPRELNARLKSGEYNEYLTTDQLATLTRQSEQAIKSQDAEARSKYSKGINEYISYMNSGGTEKRVYTEDQLKAVYGSEQGAQIYAQIQDAETFSKDLNEVRYADAEDAMGILQRNLVTGPEDFATQSKQESAMVRAVQQRNKELSADPAKYAIGSPTVKTAYEGFIASGDGRDFATTTMTEQRRLGVPQDYLSIFPQDQAQAMVKQYAQGGEDAATFMNTLREQFGDAFPIVMRDLNRAGLTPTASLVAVLGDSPAGGYLSEADKVGMQTLKTNVGKDNVTDITEMSRDQIDTDFVQTLNANAGGLAVQRQMTESLDMLAMYYLNTGMEKNAKQASKRAYNELIGDRYVFQDNYRVPTNIDGYTPDAAKVEDSLDYLLDELDYTEIMPPYDATLPLEQRQQVFSQRNNATWQTRGDDAGVELIDSNQNAMLTMDGEKIFYTWEELEMMDSGNTGLMRGLTNLGFGGL